MAEAQPELRRDRPRGGRERSAEPGSGAQAGDYAFDFDQVLEAIGRGEGHEALASYERAAAKAEQAGDALNVARALAAVSIAALRLGLYQKAISSGTRSIDLFKRNVDHLDAADLRRLVAAYGQTGSAFRSAGDFTQARQVLEEGLQFAETTLQGRAESIGLGNLSQALAMTAYAQRDYQRAAALDTRVVQIFGEVSAHLPRRAPERARANIQRHLVTGLIRLGRDHIALGHPAEAEAVLDRALKEAGTAGLTPVVQLELVRARAQLAVARRDWAQVVVLCDRALILANRMKWMGMLPWLNSTRARGLNGLGRGDEALTAVRDAVSAVEELRAGLGNAELRTDFLENRQTIYQQAVQLALHAQRPDEAFSYAERSRARAFLDLLGNDTTLSKGRTRALVDEEVRLRARLAEIQAQADASSETGQSPRIHRLAEAADRDYRAFLARVRKESLEQASLMTVEPVMLPEIQALIPDGTTLLEYFVGDGEVILWVVDRQHVAAFRTPGGRRSLVEQVRRFRGAIADRAPIGDVEAQARALYDRLLGPARRAIRGDRLLVVPHGILHYVPFSALRSPDGRWLIEEFTLSTLPSASVLRYLADKGVSAPARALVIGNPDLGPDLALPWAQREAQMVGDRVSEATVLVRRDATEAQVKRLLATAGLVHFATHGELRASDPRSSALLLMPGDGEDGRLEVREVFGLELHARLVVLSACETGLGQLNSGDELIGLQRAFLYAGTPTVVTTLWKIDDRASYELIRAFYDHLQRAGPAEALQRAQRDTMRAFPHPFAWAAFGVTGLSN